MIDEVNFDELFGNKSETTQKAKPAPAKEKASADPKSDKAAAPADGASAAAGGFL